MRLYKRSDFMKLPEGIFYGKGHPHAYYGFNYKGKTYKNEDGENFDWVEISFDTIACLNSDELFDTLDGMLKTGASYPMEEFVSRERLFEDDSQTFLVYEKDDLMIIKEYIEKAIAGTK